MQNFVQQMRRQLQFLDRSARAFDEGFEDEAIRLALALRVIFHTRGSSTSILTHLGQEKIEVATQQDRDGFDAAPQYGQAGIVFIGFVNAEMKNVPNFETPKRNLTADKWWKEEIFANDTYRYNRYLLVLHAANKDGGAHVDASLHHEYAKMLRAWEKVIPGAPSEWISPIPAALRTMAFEVLSSPQLLALVNSTPKEWTSNKQVME